MALSDNLVAYWSLDEASGNAIDAHGSNDLTETSGTIDAVTGKVGGARDFVPSDTEEFRAASNSDLTTGDIDFTFALWVNADVVTEGSLITKFTGGGGAGSEYMVDIASSRARILVRTAGGSNVTVSATTFGNLSTGTWYFIVGWHDSVANQIGISVNGTANTSSHSGGVNSGSDDFVLGSRAGGTNRYDGRIDEVGFWKRVLTSDERADLYNSGNGRDYAYITGGAATNLVIADAAHSHTADGLALTQDHQLAVQDALHAHAADSLTLTQDHALVIADAAHSHTADNVTLSTEAALAIADALHAHVADGVVLTQVHVLAVADSLHAHAADNLTLETGDTLAIAEAVHGHLADNLGLTQVHVLAIDEALHGHRADNVALNATGDLIGRRHRRGRRPLWLEAEKKKYQPRLCARKQNTSRNWLRSHPYSISWRRQESSGKHFNSLPQGSVRR